MKISRIIGLSAAILFGSISSAYSADNIGSPDVAPATITVYFADVKVCTNVEFIRRRLPDVVTIRPSCRIVPLTMRGETVFFYTRNECYEYVIPVRDEFIIADRWCYKVTLDRIDE